MLRVLIPRAAGQAAELTAALSQAGYQGVHVPLIRTNILPLPERIALGWLHPGMMVFTSKNTVRALAPLFPRARQVKIATVGRATSSALQEFNIQPDLEAPEYAQHAAGLAAVLDEHSPGSPQPLWYPCSQIAGVLPVTNPNWVVQKIPVYGTEIDFAAIERREEVLACDVIVFTSGSTVQSFHDLFGEPQPQQRIVALGPKTAQKIQQFGWGLAAVATTPSTAGVIAAVQAVA